MVGLDCSSGPPEVAASHVLLAVGRRPNTDDLGLDQAGVETDAHGFIKVDDELRTSVSHIWAIGDCNGLGAFTHTSYNDFEIVAATSRAYSIKGLTAGHFRRPRLQDRIG